MRLLFLFLAACGAAPQISAVTSAEEDPLSHKDLRGDIETVDLVFDMGTMTARGTYVIHANKKVDLEVNGLTVISTREPDGTPLPSFVTPIGAYSILTVDAASTIVIDYAFTDDTQNGMDLGFSTTRQNTLLWPDGCSALYPCHSDPEDGVAFSLEIKGATGVYPHKIDAPGPSYMLAFAIGNFTAYPAGQTTAGTSITGYVTSAPPPGYAQHLQQLRAEFDWLEQNIGPYLFGDEVGTIVVANGFGGMEHHPIWYVETIDSDTHEAAHGWFGNGVRIKCWEDLVLSEGITEYLSIRAPRALAGWNYGYANHLNGPHGPKPKPGHNKAWYPDTCDVRTAQEAFANVYSQGSGFMMELATLHGESALDGVISDFYLANAGRAARMQDFIDFVAARSQVNVNALATKWLR